MSKLPVSRVCGIFCVAGLAPLLALGQLMPPIGGAVVNVSVSSPPAGADVDGPVTAVADVSGAGAATVAGVQFRLDGSNLGAEATGWPYAIPWDTRTATDGWHSLTAIAR